MDQRGQVPGYVVQQRLTARPKNALLAALAVFLVVFVFMSASKVDTSAVAGAGREAAARIQKNMPGVHVPEQISRPFSNLHNPFRPQAHPPPEQANSTLGGTSWFSDWKWLNPFSSTVTLDEERALLPPLLTRPPIYTYYEPRDKEKEKPLMHAEEALLDVWRRAWWAQGFRPVVLGPKDAMENPLYEKLHMVKMTPGIQSELMKFVAWSHVGDGILANWLTVPMAGYNSPLLVYLRQARYEGLTRYEDLGMGLFAGPKQELDNAISFFLSSNRLETDTTLLDLISSEEGLFQIETRRKGVAFYSDKVIHEKYWDVSSVVKTSAAKGYRMLANLITAHLHATFISQYPDGIAVVAPFADEATLVPHRAITFAKVLSTCPSDAIGPDGLDRNKIGSCPPNNPDCKTCQQMPIFFPSAAPNGTTVFTIGTIPHSYTLTRLLAPHDPNFNFTVAYIRRNTERDPFLDAVTEHIAPEGTSSFARIVRFKESVAKPEKGSIRSIWRHAEADWQWDALEWRLGFHIPHRPEHTDVSNAMGDPILQAVIPDIEVPDVPQGTDGMFPEVLMPLLESIDDQWQPDRPDISEQYRIMKQTGSQLATKKWNEAGHDLRKIAEAWNLADIEAWKFVRAMSAREEVQRKKWMEEERKYRS